MAPAPSAAIRCVDADDADDAGEESGRDAVVDGDLDGIPQSIETAANAIQARALIRGG